MNKTRSFEFSSENNFLKIKKAIKTLQKYNKNNTQWSKKGPHKEPEISSPRGQEV